MSMAYSDGQIRCVLLHQFGGAISVAAAVVSIERIDAMEAAVLACFPLVLAPQVNKLGEHLGRRCRGGCGGGVAEAGAGAGAGVGVAAEAGLRCDLRVETCARALERA